MVSNDFDAAIKQEQTALRSMLNSLTPNQRQELLSVIATREKSLLVAVLLCSLYGSHQLYFGEVKNQILFWATLGGLGIWWIFEIAFLSRRVALYNLRLRRCFVQACIERLHADGRSSSTQTVVLERFQPSS